jgi:hypothetical protein
VTCYNVTMSTSYAQVSKTYNILHTMLNVASTESFWVVREQFLKSYLSNAISQGPSTPYPPWAIAASLLAVRQPAKLASAPHDIMYAPEHILSPWTNAAKKFALTLPKIYRKTASGLSDNNERTHQIEAILQMPGTPYERVGHVLAWFKDWRQQQRQLYARHPNDGYDTQHQKLQEAMTELLLDVSYAMIAEDKRAPVDSLHVLRTQPKTSVCSDPTPSMVKPNNFLHYSNYSGPQKAQRLEQRKEWMKRSEKYREQLEHASPWTIAMDWAWKSTLCFTEGSTVKTRTVPPLYTLGKYLLVADESTWDRQHVCDALIMEKTLCAPGVPAQSGLDIGLVARPTMNMERYQAWWTEQERSSARDWRYIRRSSVMLTRKSKLDNITVGDAVARIKKFGPQEVVNGAFVYEDSEIKALLLERIQPELGRQYTTLTQVEATMGPMPDVIIEALNASLNKKQKDHTEPELDMGNLFG